MMRCFLPCFRASKRSKHSRSLNATPTLALTHTHTQGVLETATQLTQQNTLESKIKFEEQSNESAEAQVTSTKELIENLEGSREAQEKAQKEEETAQVGEKKDEHEGEEECSESLFSLSIGSRKKVSAAEKAETEVNSPVQQLLGAVCTRKVEEPEAFGSSPTSVPEKVQLQHVSSVLNPLENLDQGKPPSKTTGVDSPKKEQKESTELVIAKPDDQPNRVAIGKMNNPDEEDSSAKKLDENEEEKGKARPLKHIEYRYRDCYDEGYEDMNLKGSDLDVTLEDDDPHREKRGEEGGDVNGTWVQEESSESLFSLSTDSRKPNSLAEKAENEVNSLRQHKEEETQGRIQDVSSVLNPIENVTTQGRVAKSTVLKSLENTDKENINNSAVQDVAIPLSPEPSMKLSKRKARQKLSDKEREIGVDTSLSSWLVEPESTPISKNSKSSVGDQTPKGGRGSPWSNEDRPILGALTVEEIRKYSLSMSSRRSRSKSPDETPIIGTVGSYWSHTGQTMDSNSSTSGKDAKLKSSSSTLKTRLERAFEASVCEV